MTSFNRARFSIVGSMQTDVGRVRSLNEDSVVYVLPADEDPAAGGSFLALVADGMGGHSAGEVASALAAEIVRRVYFAIPGPVSEALRTAFETANRAILEHSLSDPACHGMGTTCTALVVRENEAWFAHVGDSRAYLVRQGEIVQLSEDQSLHGQMIREGLLTEETAKHSTGGNVILQALGTKPDIAPEISEQGLPLRDGDVLVLCSDGLSNLVSNAQIAATAGRLAPPDACKALVKAALEAGGHDNISVGVFQVKQKAEEANAPATSTRSMAAVVLDAEDDEEEEAARLPASTRIIKLSAG
jgi:serine/threonine protein phosphatase PrpC